MKARAQEAEELLTGASELGVALDRARVAKLLGFLDLLYLWNRSAGLTTVDRSQAVRLHLLDSLSASPAVEEGTLADLGSGAGLPALPLAVHRPEVGVVAIESNRRKCSFLFEAKRGCEAANLEVLESDVRTIAASRRRFEQVISRAFRPAPGALAVSRSLLVPGGKAILMLAEADAAELATLAADSGLDLESSRRFFLPGGQERRCVAVFRIRQ